MYQTNYPSEDLVLGTGEEGNLDGGREGGGASHDDDRRWRWNTGAAGTCARQ
jgi:hypothetical protein